MIFLGEWKIVNFKTKKHYLFLTFYLSKFSNYYIMYSNVKIANNISIKRVVEINE